jgi:pantothenate synthetase
MRTAREQYQSGIIDVATLEKEFRTLLSTEGGWALEYAAIVDEKTLEPLTVVGASGLFLVAARRGATRLIDNLIINRLQ